MRIKPAASLLRWRQGDRGRGNLTACLALALTLLSHNAHAAMQLDRTRLVVNEAEGSATLQVYSEDRLPLLLQMWVDRDGESAQTDANISLPNADFIVDPPVMRLEPGSRRSVHVVRVRQPALESTPPERESLYWLNVLEIPALEPDRPPAPRRDADANRLYMRIKSRIKLFYRPKALLRYSTPAALEATERLRFSAGRDDAGHVWLSIDNPAPIHQSLARLTLQPAARDAAPVELDTPMLAPFERLRLDLLPDLRADLPAARLTFATINDDGNLIEGEQAL